MIGAFIQAQATHIIGGEIYYDCLGGNDYRVTVKVYRDCINGQVGFDDPLSLAIYDVNGNLENVLSIPLPGSVVLPAILDNPCFVPPGNICVEEAVYETVVNLPPKPGGYTISYQRCCRNHTILNIVNPGSVGATYTVHVPEPAEAVCNNSARYKNFPPIFLCNDVPLVFDHSAIDTDGDSLAYELCDPYDGANNGNPMPTPPDPPPYSYVPWQGGYNGSNPMSASQPMKIDPKTGMLTVTPNMLGQWVVGVCVKEYRKGKLINTNKRDFQFNVVTCDPNIVSSIPSQQLFCIGTTVQFLNNSINSSTYHWDFGVSTLSTDTSDQKTPSYIFPDTGTYTVTLIANPGWPCADTNTSTFIIKELLQPSFIPPPPQCEGANSYNFTADGFYAGTGTFQWSFGNAATPQTSNQQHPQGINFPNAGTYPVTITVSENGCVRTFTDSIKVELVPTAAVSPQIQCFNSSVIFDNQSIDASWYHWNFGEPTIFSDTSNLATPTYNFNNYGPQTVTYIANPGSQCADTAILNFFLVAPFSGDIPTHNPQCFMGNSFDFEIPPGLDQANSTLNWNFGANATINSSNQANVNGVSYATPGIHPVNLSVSLFGCPLTFTDSVEIYLEPQANVSELTQCYSSQVTFNNQSNDAVWHHWDFDLTNPSDDTSNQSAPTFTFSEFGPHTVMYIANPGLMCADTAYLNFTLVPKFDGKLQDQSGQCFIGNSFSFQTPEGIDLAASTLNWSFGPNANQTSATTPFVSGISYSDTGSFVVNLDVTMHGCPLNFIDTVIVYPMPQAKFSTQPQEGCTPYTANFTDASITATTISFYQWDFGDGKSSNDANPIHLYEQPGIYDVSLTIITSNGCIDTVSFTSLSAVTVNALPLAGIDANPKVSSIFAPLITVSDLSNGGTNCYVFFGDGDSTSQCNATHTYAKPGEYIISQVVVNGNGCMDTANTLVIIEPEFRFWIPNTFTPETRDDKNNIFMPVMYGVYDYNFMIFDRWGNRMFRTNNINEGWDGRYNGTMCQQDVYVYIIELKDEVENTYRRYVGHVNLIK